MMFQAFSCGVPIPALANREKCRAIRKDPDTRACETVTD